MWLEITKDNVDTIKIGDEVRGHNGYDWVYCTIDSWTLERGFFLAGLQNETISLLNPTFKSTYIKVANI